MFHIFVDLSSRKFEVHALPPTTNEKVKEFYRLIAEEEKAGVFNMHITFYLFLNQVFHLMLYRPIKEI
jgi:hypothetical protein